MPSGWLVRRVAIVVACVLAGCAASTEARASRPTTARPTTARPTTTRPVASRAAAALLVAVDPSRRSGRIAPDHVGLSLEPFDINSALLDPASTNIAQLLSNLGRSRLRFGGTES